MSQPSSTIVYTLTDEAPLLATAKPPPVVRRVRRSFGIAAPLAVSMAAALRHRRIHLLPLE